MKNHRKIANKIRKILQIDILWRYDNQEYWDFNLDEIGELLYGLNEEDKNKILALVR